MATQEVPVIPHTLPAGYCFTTLQDLLDTFSAHQTVELPTGATQIIVSVSPPTAEFQDEIWLKVDGGGNPVNFYKYAGGSWKEVNPPLVFWGSPTTNVVDAYTTSVAKPPPALVTGQLYLFKVPAANTGASTLQVNAFGAFPFNAAGSALTTGQLVANSYVGAVWTGTTFELLGGISTFPVSKIVPGTNTQRITTVSGVSAWAGGYEKVTPVAVPVVTGVTTILHSLGVVPDQYQFYLVCTGNNNGFVTGERIQIEELYTSSGDNEQPIFGGTCSATSVKIRCNNLNNTYTTLNGSTGALVNIFADIGNWNIGASLWVF